MRRPGGLMLAACASAGVAFGQSADVPERMRARTVCDYIAATPAEASLAGDRVGLFASDGLVWQGVLDLDNDGAAEIVQPSMSMGSMGGDGYDIVRADGEATYVGREGASDSEMPDGFGGAFLNFSGRWFFVVFSWETGAFPVGALMFEAGVKPVTACRFGHVVEETMQLANIGSNADADWCRERAVAEARSGRLKPAVMLSEGEEAALAEALTAETQASGSALQGFSGREIYRPTRGPLADLLLWKVNNSSGAGRGCAGQFFRIVTQGEDGAYRLSGDARQTLLNRMQAGSDELAVYNCVTDVDLFETGSRFFVERHAGDAPPTIDAQLVHSIVEARGEGAAEICSASFRVTPQVSYAAPELAP